MINISRRYSTISLLMSIDLNLSGTTLAYMKDHERKHLVRCQYNSKLGEKKNTYERTIDVKILLQS